jgi:hypothetical protein
MLLKGYLRDVINDMWPAGANFVFERSVVGQAVDGIYL